MLKNRHMLKHQLPLFLLTLTLTACAGRSGPLLPTSRAVSVRGLQAESLLPDLKSFNAADQEQLEKALATSRTDLQAQQLTPTLRKTLNKLLPYLKTRYGYMRRPRHIKSTRLPDNAEPLTLQSADGTPIQGFFLAAADPAGRRKTVILQHGYQFNKWMAFERYGFLQKQYNVLALDFRAHNGQPGESSLGIKEREDITAALRWLEHRFPAPREHQVGLLGESMGAATVMAAAADWSSQGSSVVIKGVWNDAAYADLYHALEERIFKGLAEDLSTTPTVLKKWGAGMITRTYLRWLAQDTKVRDVERVAAPKYTLKRLLSARPAVRYAQVHSVEDEQTSFENAQILSKVVETVTGQPFSFWQARGKHVETYRQPEYAPRVRQFFAAAFQP